MRPNRMKELIRSGPEIGGHVRTGAAPLRGDAVVSDIQQGQSSGAERRDEPFSTSYVDFE